MQLPEEWQGPGQHGRQHRTYWQEHNRAGGQPHQQHSVKLRAGVMGAGPVPQLEEEPEDSRRGQRGEEEVMVSDGMAVAEERVGAPGGGVAGQG